MLSFWYTKKDCSLKVIGIKPTLLKWDIKSQSYKMQIKEL